MAKDQKSHSGSAENEQGGTLRNALLLVLPLFSFQRNILELAKTGLENAIGVRPVQNLLLSEIHAALMILDPDRKWRARLGVDLENKIKDLVEETTSKVISGSVQLLEAQEIVVERVIDVLQALKDGQKRRAERI